MPRAVLDNDFVTTPPKFDEKLLFVFEIVPVTPLVVAPTVTPPGQVVPEPTEWQLATKSPELPLPGAIKTGQGILPNFIGQGSPVAIEGHNITHLALDMQTHGFSGTLRFRVSETRLLGDVKDKDRVAKLFSGDDLLMMKLVIRPKFGDQEFPMAMTPVMVPQIVGTVPVPVAPPAPPPPIAVIPPVPPLPVIPAPPLPAPPAVTPPPPPPTVSQPAPALPIPIPTLPVVPAAGPTAGSPLGQLAALASSPAVQSVLEVGAEVGVTALVASNPELAPVFIALGVAAQAGLIPPPAAGPATAAASTLLSAQPQLAAGLAALGMAANAGMLPPEVTPLAAAAGQLAMQSSPELQGMALLAGQSQQAPTGAAPPAGTAPATLGSNAPSSGAPPPALASFAQLASNSGLLPPGLASAISASPAQALASGPLAELLPLLNQAAPLAAQLAPGGLPSTGLPAPAAPPALPPASPQPGSPPSLPPPILPVPVVPSTPPPPPPPPIAPAALPQIHVQPTVPGALPPNLQPLYQETPELVGTPKLYEDGISPRSLMIPIELTITAVITERTIVEHSSYNTDELLVSIREYCIRFSDPAQALWRRHFPVAMYTNTTLKAVIEEHCNPLINVKISGPQIAVTQDQIFIACDADQSDRERASYYDWLMWRLSELQHEWQYDYSQNLYLIVPRPKKGEPHTVFAADIAEVVTHHIEGRFYCETLMNDYTASVSRDPIINLQTLQPLRQDRLHHSQVPLLYEREFLDRMASFEQPQPDFILHFKRFPSRPFPPGVGVDFKLDPIDFPSHRVLIPKDAKKASRVYRLRIELETKESDVLPRFQGYSGGMFRCAVAAQLQSGKDKAPRLPRFRTPRYPMDIEGLVHTDTGLPGEQPYQTFVDVMGLVSLRVAIPLFANQLVKVPFEPYYQSGHFFFPPYRAERVLVRLFHDRAEFKRFLNWRPGGLMPTPTQGNQIRMGQDMMNGAVMRLVYAADIPTYLVQRQRYSSNQTMTMYQSGIDLRTVELPPNIDVKAQRIVRAAGAAVEVASGAKDIGAMVGSKLPGGAGKAAAKAMGRSDVAVRSERARSAQRGSRQAGSTRAATALDTRPQSKPHSAVTTAAAPRGLRMQRSQGSGQASRVGGVATLSRTPAVSAKASGTRSDARRSAVLPGAKVDAQAFQQAFPLLSQRAEITPSTPVPQAKRPRTRATAAPGTADPSGYATPGGALSGAAGGAGEYAAAVTGSTAEGVASLLAAAAGSAMSAALNLDSNLGVTMQYTPMPLKAVQTLRMDDKKNTLMSFVDTKASMIEQAGDTITITCKDFIVNAANIHLNSALSTTVQSLGTVSIMSKLAMLLKSMATLDISSDLAATLQALSITVDALGALAMQGIEGVGIFGNGTGVQLFGSQVSATGMEASLVGQTTQVLGNAVSLSTPAPVSPPSTIAGLIGGDLPALAARLAAPAPLAVPAAKIAELASEISTLVTALPIKGPP